MNKIYIYLIILTYVNINTTLAQDVILKNNDTWHYYDQDYLENDWYNNLDISSWKEGISPIGYGDKKNYTSIFIEEDKNTRKITKYFAKKINIKKEQHLAYEFKLLRDDGAVIYINGKELYKDNMPNLSVSNTTFALSTIKGDNEHIYHNRYFDNTIFKEGENLISVEIHQAYQTSSDCIFSLEIVGHNNPEILSLVLQNKNKTNIELEEKLELLNLKFENEKILNKKENLEILNFNLKIFILLISFFLILSLFGYYYIFLNIKKRKLNQETILSDLKSEVLSKQKEIISLSTNLLHYKQYFKEIKADTKSIKTEDKSIIKSILNQIDYVLENDEDWKILKQHFNAVHENFFDKLLVKHPSLSETELRHCMFIKLHFQTKEIARILSIDPRSVQTARYRIKKKMDLEEDVDLRNYLLKL